MKYDRESLVEKLADLEHRQWVEWSKAVAPDIKDPERVARWQAYWVPYDQLDAKTKDLDREWAEEVMNIIEPLLGAQSAKEMVMKLNANQAPMLAKLLGKPSMIQQIKADAEKAEGHCYTTWHEGLRKLEEAQAIFNKAMNMSAEENLPMEMKSSLADLISQAYALQLTTTELLEELREVDAGAPPAPKEDEEVESALYDDKQFVDYLMEFYGPGEMYGDFFDNNLKPEEIQEAMKLLKADKSRQFEADTFDRELVRDIMLYKRGKRDVEHDVKRWVK